MKDSLDQEKSLNGVGIGMRSPHLSELLDTENELSQSIPWLEILADNYLNVGGFYAAHLSALAERFPLTFHCVGMSVGSNGPINTAYLNTIKKLADQHNPVWVSDHLSWSNFQNQRSHDLLPLCYNEESLSFLINRVNEIQDILERPLMLENISAYYAHAENEFDEAVFIRELCSETGCSILLDVNNLYVNHRNLNIDTASFLSNLPKHQIQQLHLGGHEKRGEILVDSHGSSICDEVWQLYREVIHQLGPIPTLIEWDNNVPDLDVLITEKNKAQEIIDACKLSSASNLTYSQNLARNSVKMVSSDG